MFYTSVQHSQQQQPCHTNFHSPMSATTAMAFMASTSSSCNYTLFTIIIRHCAHKAGRTDTSGTEEKSRVTRYPSTTAQQQRRPDCFIGTCAPLRTSLISYCDSGPTIAREHSARRGVGSTACLEGEIAAPLEGAKGVNEGTAALAAVGATA